MKIQVLLIMLLILSGCALSSGFHDPIGDNFYKVGAGGNMWDTEETLLATIHKRAAKLCGADNFTVLGDDPIVVDSVQTEYATAPTQTLIRYVRCK